MTQKGIGNGVSLIIMAGIIATLPQMFITAFTSLIPSDGTTQLIALGIIKFILFVIVYFGIIIGMIFVQVPMEMHKVSCQLKLTLQELSQ